MDWSQDRVFLSSTFKELENERIVVRKALEQEGFLVWDPSPTGPAGRLSHKNRCLKKIKEADWMVCLVGTEPGFKLRDGTPFVRWEYNKGIETLKAFDSPLMFVYVKKILMDLGKSGGVSLEEEHREFVEEITHPEQDSPATYFESAVKLAEQVVRDIKLYASEKKEYVAEAFSRGTRESRRIGRMVRTVALLFLGFLVAFLLFLLFFFRLKLERLDLQFKVVFALGGIATFFSIYVAYLGDQLDKNGTG